MRIFCAILFSLIVNVWAGPLSLHPDNPHYFLFEGRPVVLIGSGEHYGAVMNLDFDYDIYLNTMGKEGQNLTRVFTGSYVEKKAGYLTSAPD